MTYAKHQSISTPNITLAPLFPTRTRQLHGKRSPGDAGLDQAGGPPTPCVEGFRPGGGAQLDAGQSSGDRRSQVRLRCIRCMVGSRHLSRRDDERYGVEMLVADARQVVFVKTRAV